MFAPLVASLVQPAICSVVKGIKGISGRGVRKARGGYMDKKFLFCFILWIISRLLIMSILNLDLSGNNLSRKKDGPYVTNLDDEKGKGTHWVLLFIDKNTAVYFDCFEIEYILQEVLNKIKIKLIAHNIFRIPDNESIMCGFYCNAFIEYILAGKTLLDYTNLFSLNDYKVNDKIICKYFKDRFFRSWV